VDSICADFASMSCCVRSLQHVGGGECGGDLPKGCAARDICTRRGSGGFGALDFRRPSGPQAAAVAVLLGHKCGALITQNALLRPWTALHPALLEQQVMDMQTDGQTNRIHSFLGLRSIHPMAWQVLQGYPPPPACAQKPRPDVGCGRGSVPFLCEATVIVGEHADTLAWRAHKEQSSTPPAAAGLTLTAAGARGLYAFGGQGKKCTNLVHRLNPESAAWSAVAVSGVRSSSSMLQQFDSLPQLCAGPRRCWHFHWGRGVHQAGRRGLFLSSQAGAGAGTGDWAIWFGLDPSCCYIPSREPQCSVHE
jgi:hypothetical protein